MQTRTRQSRKTTKKNKAGVWPFVIADSLKGENREDTKLLRQMSLEAKGFLLSHEWCDSVRGQYFGIGVGGIVAVFLFKIRPSRKGIDEWLWVVTGDLPPAYIVAEDNPSPLDAIQAYVHEMRKWTVATRKGKRVDDLIPVNAPPNLDFAHQLENRLNFIEEKLIPQFRASTSASKTFR